MFQVQVANGTSVFWWSTSLATRHFTAVANHIHDYDLIFNYNTVSIVSYGIGIIIISLDCIFASPIKFNSVIDVAGVH